MPDPMDLHRPRFLRSSRDVWKFTAGAIALEAFFGYVLGWGLASVVIMVGLIGFQLGHIRGFNFGMDQGFANFLRVEIGRLSEFEEGMAEHYAPDSPERAEVARVKGELVRRLREVA